MKKSFVAAIRGGHPWRANRMPERTDVFLDLRVPPSMEIWEAGRLVQPAFCCIRRGAPHI
jgi:hypothetical protein